MDNYIIVKAETTEELEEKVNEFMLDGYYPQGSVFYTDIFWCQPMIKERYK